MPAFTGWAAPGARAEKSPPSGGILLCGLFETKIDGFPVVLPLGIVGLQGDGGESVQVSAGKKATATVSLTFSNVVSVAKNDELNNPVTMRRKVKGVHEWIW